MFRRSSAGETEPVAAGGESAQSREAPAKTKPPAQAGKGRPTPKRSQAERGRYRSIQGGTTSGRAAAAPRDPGRKLTPEEKAREKERARADRARRMDAMRKGEDWALGPRDRGPLRRLARDYVDSRRRPSEFYMYALLVLLVALFSRSQAAQTFVGPLVFVLIAVIAIDGYLISRALRRLVAERFPGESARGLTWYAVMRAMQIRRFRNPQPRIKPGDEI